MKLLLFIVTTLFATTLFGQITNDKTTEAIINSLPKGFFATPSFGQITNNKTRVPDTALRVIYVDKDKLNQMPAYFIDGRFIINQALLFNQALPFNVTPDNIANVEVRKTDTIIDNKLFHGQVYIKTKEGFTPQFITLTELKNKYTNLKDEPVIFILDGNLVNADYDNYLINENNLLTIIIDSLQTGKEKMEIGLIKLLSKTRENIKARNQIIIRGTAFTMNE